MEKGARVSLWEKYKACAMRLALALAALSWARNTKSLDRQRSREQYINGNDQKMTE